MDVDPAKVTFRAAMAWTTMKILGALIDG